MLRILAERSKYFLCVLFHYVAIEDRLPVPLPHILRAAKRETRVLVYWQLVHRRANVRRAVSTEARSEIAGNEKTKQNTANCETSFRPRDIHLHALLLINHAQYLVVCASTHVTFWFYFSLSCFWQALRAPPSFVMSINARVPACTLLQTIFVYQWATYLHCHSCLLNKSQPSAPSNAHDINGTFAKL